MKSRVISEPLKFEKIPTWHFCDNQQDADECAKLVVSGIKRATTPSVWELKIHGEEIPKIGDLNIITNWNGVAQCLIQTTGVEVLPFRNISAKHAELEGEGDLSLSYWREVHWDYYHRVLAGSPYTVSEDMPVVFEQFIVIFSGVLKTG